MRGLESSITRAAAAAATAAAAVAEMVQRSRAQLHRPPPPHSCDHTLSLHLCFHLRIVVSHSLSSAPPFFLGLSPPSLTTFIPLIAWLSPHLFSLLSSNYPSSSHQCSRAGADSAYVTSKHGSLWHCYSWKMIPGDRRWQAQLWHRCQVDLLRSGDKWTPQNKNWTEMLLYLITLSGILLPPWVMCLP